MQGASKPPTSHAEEMGASRESVRPSAVRRDARAEPEDDNPGASRIDVVHVDRSTQGVLETPDKGPLGSLRREIAKLTHQAAAVERSLEDQRRDRREALERLENAAGRASELEVQVSTLEAEVRTVHAAHETSLRTVHDLTAERDALRRDLEAVQASREDASALATQAVEEGVRIRRDLAAQAHAELQGALDKSRCAELEARARADAAAVEVRNLGVRLSASVAEIEALREAGERAKDETSLMRDDLAKKRDEIARAKDDNQRDRATARERIDVLERGLDEARSAASVAGELLAVARAELTSRLIENRAELDDAHGREEQALREATAWRQTAEAAEESAHVAILASANGLETLRRLRLSFETALADAERSLEGHGSRELAALRSPRPDSGTASPELGRTDEKARDSAAVEATASPRLFSMVDAREAPSSFMPVAHYASVPPQVHARSSPPKRGTRSIPPPRTSSFPSASELTSREGEALAAMASPVHLPFGPDIPPTGDVGDTANTAENTSVSSSLNLFEGQTLDASWGTDPAPERLGLSLSEAPRTDDSVPLAARPAASVFPPAAGEALRDELLLRLKNPDLAIDAKAELLRHPSWLCDSPPDALIHALSTLDYPAESSLLEIAQEWERAPLCEALIGSLAHQRDPRSREHTAWLLKHLASANHVEALATLAKNEEESVPMRRWLLEGLDRLAAERLLGFRELADVITTLARHPDATLREGVVGVLLSLDRSDEKRRVLLDILRTDNDELVLASAVNALQSVLPIELDPAVVDRLLGHPSPRVQLSLRAFIERARQARTAS